MVVASIVAFILFAAGLIGVAWTVGYTAARRVVINRRWPNAMRTASIWLAMASVCFVVAAFLLP